jgi:hypothetical protein
LLLSRCRRPKESASQRLPRENVTKKAKVDSTKQLQFANNICSVLARKIISLSDSSATTLIQICCLGVVQYADFQEAQEALSPDQTKLLALEVI